MVPAIIHNPFTRAEISFAGTTRPNFRRNPSLPTRRGVFCFYPAKPWRQRKRFFYLSPVKITPDCLEDKVGNSKAPRSGYRELMTDWGFPWTPDRKTKKDGMCQAGEILICSTQVQAASGVTPARTGRNKLKDLRGT